jgi:hypothetical protein
MQKILAIFALAFFVLCVQGCPQAHEAKQRENGDKPTSTATPVAPQQANSPNLQGKPDHDVRAEVRVVSTPAKDGYDRASVWVNFSLAVIGLIGIGAAFVTLRKLERQTVAAEGASKAALLNAQAIINSERAWIILQSDENPIRRNTDNTYGYCWTIKNVGRTPARLIETAAICAKREKSEPLNDTPDFSDPPPLRLNNRLLAPGDILRFQASIEGGPERENLGFNEITDSYLVAYGYVSYIDSMGGDEHIAGFCEYCAHVNAMQMPQTFWAKFDAPTAYTQAT